MGKVILEEHIDRPCRVCSGTTFRIRPCDGRRVCYTCMKNGQKKYRNGVGKDKMREWQQSNKEHIREYQREYYSGKYQERNAKYSKDLAKRTPSWADKKEIIEFYKNCPKGYEVDHVIPLRGKNVSGLHIRSNLQYLTKEENRKKYNKFQQ